jgi:hypothetical protein
MIRSSKKSYINHLVRAACGNQSKIWKFGIRGNIFKVLKSYLFRRKQKIMNETITSTENHIRSGVPQMSSLSTLLFLIYINDFLDLPIRGYAQLYADDALLIYSGHDLGSLCNMINEDMILINKWFYENLLSFNASKTKYMLITPRNKNIPFEPQIHANGIRIERVTTFKYLGLTLDQHLTWNDHIDTIVLKCKPILAMLRKSCYLLPADTKLSVYYAHVHSHLIYMASIWGATTQSRLDDLQILQNKAIRFVFWHDYHHLNLSTNQIFKKYKILRMKDVVKYEFMMTLF